MKKILLVDNNPVLLKLMSNLLAKQEGHQVVTAENGLEALDILQTFTPDILFVDLIMPKIGGAKLCRIIRDRPHLKNIFIVLLSGIAKEAYKDLPDIDVNICIAKGSFVKTKKHVLRALEVATGGGGKKNEILGFNDIYERSATTELLSWKKHFEVILNNMSEAILEMTPQGRIIYVNPSTSKLFGLAEEDMLGALFPGYFKEDHRQRVEDLLAGDGRTNRSSGDQEPVPINNRLVRLNFFSIWDEGQESVIVIILDVTSRKRMEKKLRKISITDELTGLLNRRGFMAMADKLFKIGERKKDKLYLVFADLDNLKKINDLHGHEVGDMAIVQAAQVLNDTFRQSDIIGRLGGDEFAVLTSGDLSDDSHGTLCDRFQETINESNRRHDLGFTLEISTGIARYDSQNPCTLDEFISKADSLMYECKRKKKKNCSSASK